MKLIKILLLLLISINGFSQVTLDSNKYKDSVIKELKAKIVNSRYCIYNIQDYVNLCKVNPKLNKFSPDWIQRILNDYYFKSGEISPSRKDLNVAKKKQFTKKKK